MQPIPRLFLDYRLHGNCLNFLLYFAKATHRSWHCGSDRRNLYQSGADLSWWLALRESAHRPISTRDFHRQRHHIRRRPALPHRAASPGAAVADASCPPVAGPPWTPSAYRNRILRRPCEVGTAQRSRRCNSRGRGHRTFRAPLQRATSHQVLTT
jgi:hypothetical protein